MAQYVQYDTTHPIPRQEFQSVFLLMKQAFPPEERRTEAGQTDLLAQPAYRLTVRREKNGKITAFFAWWQFDGFRYGEHFAVDESLRGMGIGGEMLYMLTASSEPFVLEAEPPETDLARRRIRFYRRGGFVVNPFEYWQPPLHPGNRPLPLCFLSHPAALSEDEFVRMRTEIYRTVYGLSDSERMAPSESGYTKGEPT